MSDDRFIRWKDVARVERMFDDGLRFALRPVFHGGSRPAFADPDANKDGYIDHRDRDPVDVRKLDPTQRDVLYATTLRWRIPTNNPSTGIEQTTSSTAPLDSTRGIVSLLAIGSRQPDTWLEAISRAVPREGYRNAAAPDEELESIARDVDADASARLAAAIILRRRGKPAPRVHLDDRMDIVLQRHMEQAMLTLADDPAATQAVLAFAREWIPHCCKPSRVKCSMRRGVRSGISRSPAARRGWR